MTGSTLSNLVRKNSPVGTLFNFLALLIGLFAITGMNLWQREAAGIFGAIAYVLVFVGLALMMCIDYLGTFAMPGLDEDELARMRQKPAMMSAMISGLIFFVGEILFGISVILAGIFSKIAAVLFMTGFLPTPLKQAYPRLVVLGALLSEAGIIWWGLSLWSFSV